MPVVPGVATTVPTPPARSRAASASRSIRPRASCAHGLVARADDGGHARVRVVRVLAGDDRAVRVQLARHPERLEVRDRARGGQVPEVLRQREHLGDLRDRLALHLGRRGAAVEGVVVRVEQHRRRVGRPRDRRRRLEHLAGVARVGVRIGVAEPLGQLGERRALVVGRLVPVLQRGAERQQRARPVGEPVRHRRRETDVARVHATSAARAGRGRRTCPRPAARRPAARGSPGSSRGPRCRSTGR